MRPVLCVLLLAAGCGQDAGFDGRTTDGALARANLESRLRALRALEERGSPHPSLARERLAARLRSARFFGTRRDLAGALDAVDEGSDDAEYLAVAARAAVELERCDLAERLLDRAEAIDGRSRLSERTAVDLARGRDVERALRTRVRAAAARPTYATLFDVAEAYAALGRVDDAERSYLRALALYRDVSPFEVARVQVRRGALLAEATDPSGARALYRDAVDRLPGYVEANERLAALAPSRVRVGALVR